MESKFSFILSLFLPSLSTHTFSSLEGNFILKKCRRSSTTTQGDSPFINFEHTKSNSNRETIMSEGKLTMKLLVDKSKNKVLFGEAGKECVDFLFHILSLPLGSVVGFLTKESMAGSIGSLYGSLENLSTDYLQDGLNKDCLLNPKTAAGAASNVPLLTSNQAPVKDISEKTLYICNNIYRTTHGYFSDVGGTICPNCSGKMNVALTYITPTVAQTKAPIPLGYVKGVITYMIMDDLSVQPMSMVSSIALLNKFKVTDVGSLEEKEVSLDINLGVALLKASLISKTVLSDVFLVNKLDIID